MSALGLRNDEAGILRVIYLAKRPEGVYVLHCFQKKAQRTNRADLELATKRFINSEGSAVSGLALNDLRGRRRDG